MAKNCYRLCVEGFLSYNGNILAKDCGNYVRFPGGGVDEGESIEAAFARECLEETGAIVEEMKIIGCIKFPWPRGWIKKSKKCCERAKIYCGVEIYFVIGTVRGFVKESGPSAEDYWKPTFMTIDDLETKIERIYLAANRDELDYRSMQLKIIRKMRGFISKL